MCTFIVCFALAFCASAAFADDDLANVRPPGSCDENQEWTACATACEPQCNNFRGQKCGLFITMNCIPKCACSPGYLRIEGDKCIPADSEECGGLWEPKWPEELRRGKIRLPRADQSQISSPIFRSFVPVNRVCPETMVWASCATVCEPQCANFKGPRCGPFITWQCSQQCVCKPGKLRLDDNTCAPEDSVECGGRYKLRPPQFIPN